MLASKVILEPARRLHRSWSKGEPAECRTPVPLDVARGLLSVFMASGNCAATVIVMLGFHCLIRTEELMTMTWGDLMLAPQIVRERYPKVACLVSIPKPKLWTGVGRNNVQFVVDEDSALAPIFSWLIKDLSERDLRQHIWPNTTTGLPLSFARRASPSWTRAGQVPSRIIF